MMSDFNFVDNKILRTNLDNTFEHILDLVSNLESETYKGKVLLTSSLRKTIIIHTASIIEALLTWKLSSLTNDNGLNLKEEWQYLDPKILYKIDENNQIVGCMRKKRKMKTDEIDFNRIIDLCYKHKVISSEQQYKNLHNVRKMRNKLHLAGLPDIEQKYQKTDLEFCFKVLVDTVKITAN